MEVKKLAKRFAIKAHKNQREISFEIADKILDDMRIKYIDLVNKEFN